MGAFEHVISLLSFVYALAIAHLLTTVARLIGSRERVRFSWLHGFWMLNALTVLVADWIGYWDMHALASWTVPSILIVVVQSFIDYLQAALVCPEIPQEGTIDLVAFHKTRSRRYIGAFAATTIMALVDNFYFADTYDISHLITENFTVVPLIAIALTAAISSNRIVQIAAPFLISSLWVYYFIALQGALH